MLQEATSVLPLNAVASLVAAQHMRQLEQDRAHVACRDYVPLFDHNEQQGVAYGTNWQK